MTECRIRARDLEATITLEPFTACDLVSRLVRSIAVSFDRAAGLLGGLASHVGVRSSFQVSIQLRTSGLSARADRW
jgi:hypothetical protein